MAPPNNPSSDGSNAVDFGVKEMAGQLGGIVQINTDKIKEDGKGFLGGIGDMLGGLFEGDNFFGKIIGFFISLFTGGADALGNLVSGLFGGEKTSGPDSQPQQSPEVQQATQQSINNAIQDGIKTTVNTTVNQGVNALIGDIPLLNKIAEPLSNAVATHVNENFISSAPSVPNASQQQSKAPQINS